MENKESSKKSHLNFIELMDHSLLKDMTNLVKKFALIPGMDGCEVADIDIFNPDVRNDYIKYCGAKMSNKKPCPKTERIKEYCDYLEMREALLIYIEQWKSILESKDPNIQLFTV